MTENEAIEILSDFDMQISEKADGACQSTIGEMACKVAVKALEEIQQYRSLGTVEECREARERQKPKVPDIWSDGYDEDGNMIFDMYDCPNCGESYEIDYQKYDYCPNCGQAIDWPDMNGGEEDD